MRYRERDDIIGVLIDPPGVEVEPHNEPPNNFYLMRAPDARFFGDNRHFRIVTLEYDYGIPYLRMNWWLNAIMDDSEIAKETYECL